jgi:hypothetical protein
MVAPILPLTAVKDRDEDLEEGHEEDPVLD